MKIKRAVYPGTFDPITNGHMDIIQKASNIFDEIFVAVAKSDEKKPMFSHKQRIEMTKVACKSLDNVKVEGFSNLLVEFCHQNDINIIIRGLRSGSDFEYELQMGYANTSLDSKIETIFLMPSLKNSFISSSIVRSILKHSSSCKHLLPSQVNDIILNNSILKTHKKD